MHFVSAPQVLKASQVFMNLVRVSWHQTPFRFRLFLRPTVSRPICLGVGPPSGAHDQISITVGHLRSSCCGAPSLVQFNVTLRSKFRKPSTTSYCLIRDSPNLEGQVPVFTSPRNRVAQLYPRALGSLFVSSYDSQGYDGGILTRLHTGGQIPSQRRTS
jgi:hypothetical protein